MKREIKYRGKSIVGFGYNICGTWFYGGIIINPNGREIHIAYFDEDMLSWRNVPVDPETVGQYTGLKDRNGKEIYEGDVVKTSWYNQPLEVIYLEYQFLFEIKANVNYKYVSFDNFEWPDDFEVIGNIYDNPDLLEG